MTFNSVEFLLFFPIVAFLYFLLPKKFKWPLLLIASYYFYMCHSPALVLLIFGTTLVSWISARKIERCKSARGRKTWLTLALAVSLGVLFFFKYFNFLADTATGAMRLFGLGVSDISLRLILPVGISFYTFQTLSYVIDVYRGDIECEKSFFFYALYVSFFPQLVAGPIERPGNLIPELRRDNKFRRENFVLGSRHMLLGFFKKICVADLLATYVNAVYNSPRGATSLGVIIATVLFGIQIYCDFSGYTDIAIGCARIMGIRLMKNFDHPYMATTVKEFWGRWHISLSTWFRDYLYFPLGGSRVHPVRYAFNIMVVFLVSGLWHGAAWTFVIWGALHGIYQVIGRFTIGARNRLLEKMGISPTSLPVVWVRRALTFILVSFAWIFFRANSISDIGFIFKALFTNGGGIANTLGTMGFDALGILTVLFSIALLLMLDRMVSYELEGDGSSVLTRDGGFVIFVLLILLSFALLLSSGRASTFIYFQF